MQKIIIWLIIIVLLIWGGFALLGGGETDSDVIKVGFVAPLTGEAAIYGEPFQQVAQIAVDEINEAGGVDGKTLELIYEDGKCAGKDAANAINKLINVDGVEIVLGGGCSGETLAMVPIAEANKVVVLSASATSPDLTGVSPYFFRNYSSDATQGTVIAQAAIDRGDETVGIIQEQTDYATAFGETVKTALEAGDVEVPVVEEFASGASDFRSSLAKLKAAEIDSLLVSVQASDAGERIFKQIEELDWKPQIMIIDSVSSNPPTIEQYSELLEGALAAEFVIDEENPTVQSIAAKYDELYQKEVPFQSFTAAIYDAVYLIKDAIEAVGNDGEAIAEWSRTVKDWEGASGSITIQENGDRASGHQLKVVRDGVVEIAE